MPHKGAYPGDRIVDLDRIASFDAVIDVRSPAEFEDDHLPGAISAPVLSNEERAIVGTMYRQESAFQATRVGAAMVARNLAQHLETTFADKPRDWAPLVYCWRGGKRSGSVTAWMNLIGWKACKLRGGYKAWRRHVMDLLDRLPPTFQFKVVAGPTGSGKTRLLHGLQDAGAQVLDLEGLAQHRGSAIGALPHTAQPSQRHFETMLVEVLQGFDPEQPVFVEAESFKIGQIKVPDALMTSMRRGECVVVEASMEERIHYLLEDYAHLFDEPDGFKAQLGQLVGMHSKATIAAWQSCVDARDAEHLFRQLVAEHYDPGYRRSSHKHYTQLADAIRFAFDPSSSDVRGQACQLLEQMEISHD